MDETIGMESYHQSQGNNSSSAHHDLAGAVERVLNSPHVLPLHDWLIIPDQSCWILYIDAVVLVLLQISSLEQLAN